MSYVLGLDLGTSGLKGILVNREGEVVFSSSSDYPLISPKRGYSEQDPKVWYEATLKVIKDIINKIPNATSTIEGISISGQMHSLVLLNKEDEVIRNAILWNDVRTTEQSEKINTTLGDQLINITKNKALEGFTLPKLLWVQENEPENWEQIDTFFMPKDYLGFRLTGNKQTEYSDASGTLLLDISGRQWSQEILETFNIDPNICPELVESTSLIGHLQVEIAEEIGLKNTPPIFAGGADNPLAAIGAGIVEPNQALASIGTSGVFLTYEEDGQKDYNGQLHFFNHAMPNDFYSMGVTLAAGSSLSWFKEQFAPEESFEKLLDKIDEIPAGSDGLLFAPYISGERTPYTDSKIRGSFLGVDINHTRDHFAKSVLEGITFSLRDSQELMRKHTAKQFNQIVSVGGGAKNIEWLQMQADIFNTPVVTLKAEQGPAMGAAMIATVGTGWFNNFKECSKKFVKYNEEIIPDSNQVAIYDVIYSVYREIYEATKEISHRLSTE